MSELVNKYRAAFSANRITNKEVMCLVSNLPCRTLEGHINPGRGRSGISACSASRIREGIEFLDTYRDSAPQFPNASGEIPTDCLKCAIFTPALIGLQQMLDKLKI